MIKWLTRFLKPTKKFRFDFSNAKRQCRIILIDDDNNALPISELTNDYYVIRQENKVDADLLADCERGEFDIILLDYNGIAPKSLTPDDGFGVFNRIRAANPYQYIIAVSGQAYDISKTKYFKEANDWINKPTDLASTKTKLDKGITYIFDKTQTIERLRLNLVNEGLDAKAASNVTQEFFSEGVDDIDEAAAQIKKICNIAEISESTYSVLRSVVRSFLTT